MLVFIIIADMAVLNSMAENSALTASSSFLFHHAPPHVICWGFFAPGFRVLLSITYIATAAYPSASSEFHFQDKA